MLKKSSSRKNKPEPFSFKSSLGHDAPKHVFKLKHVRRVFSILGDMAVLEMTISNSSLRIIINNNNYVLNIAPFNMKMIKSALHE